MDVTTKAKYDKLIGEFIGHKNVKINDLMMEVGCYVEAPNDFWKEQFPKGVYMRLNYLVWDKLMPVIKKIEDSGDSILITTDIESTYLRVVEFIKK